MSSSLTSVDDGKQYALALFEETVGRKGSSATIADAQRDLQFRKHNILIDVGKMSLLGRRCLNVMNFLAAGAPVEVLDFDVDLALFKFLLNYESRNHKHLEDAMTEGQRFRIRVERERVEGRQVAREFVSIPLVGTLGIANGRVFFKFDEAIRRLHKDPRGYTFLSLRTTAAFSSQYAHALYENLKAVAFRGSPTSWFELQEVHRWVGVESSDYLAEFKWFKLRVLEKARDEINRLTDLFIDYETRSSPGSKKITHLRFTLREQEGLLIQSLTQTASRKTLYDTLRGEFGLGTSDIEHIIHCSNEYTPSRIESAIAFVRHRMAKSKKPIHAPGKLFMRALQEQWTIPTAELVQDAVALPSAPLPSPGLADPVKRAVKRRGQASPAAAAKVSEQAGTTEQSPEFTRRGEQGFQAYQGMGKEEQARLRSSFSRTVLFRAVQARLKREKTPVTAQELESVAALRVAFGVHVLNTLARMARSGSESPATSSQAGLFGA
ncbi:replication initiation protein [Azohydromonas aeria]|uniref:replication initiation protein n=1 Tax=Azohydromonas aeria TaxID=2590212 RepID=UPI0012FCE2DF|nr:replication initiation protein [Azohydromonas aeria]